MFNTLLCAEKMSFVDKLAEAGIVVLIGVTLVFIILAFLIGIIYILKHFNVAMNKWDDKMATYRSNKAYLKSIKNEYYENKNNKINEIYLLLEKGEIDNAEAKKRIVEIKADFLAIKPEIKAKVAEAKLKLANKTNTNVENALVIEESQADIFDEKIIAVITAAIAVATEQECAIRKVKFKVRSIKEVK